MPPFKSAEQERVHETQDVESHLFGGERVNVVALDLLRHNVCGRHETRASSPAISPPSVGSQLRLHGGKDLPDDSAGKTEIFNSRSSIA